MHILRHISNTRSYAPIKLGLVRRTKNIAFLLAGAVMLVFGSGSTQVFAATCPEGMSKLDCDAIYGNWESWVPDTCAAGPSIVTAGLTTLSGTDNPEKIFSFLTNQAGLTKAAAAGIMGNMQEESGLNPASEQLEHISWDDMTDRYYHNKNGVKYGGGVGLTQWDGPRRPRYIKEAIKQNVDRKDLAFQLSYLKQELSSSYKVVMTGGDFQGKHYPGLTDITDARQAARSFHALYEKSADDDDAIKERLDAAEKILNSPKLGGVTPGVLPISQSNGCDTGAVSDTLSPECTTAVGNARILCEARKYDPISYLQDGSEASGHGSPSAWHTKHCPSINKECTLDCSGLVNIAVYDVYRVVLRENTDGQRRDSDVNGGNGKYWKQVTFEQLLPGDIIQPHPGHVEIVDHKENKEKKDGKKIYTFGAHGRNDRLQKDNVGPSVYPKEAGQLYLRYVGPGSGTGGASI